ncbi:hypothetical protein ACF0H5_004878 [Mactra antiquata]
MLNMVVNIRHQDHFVDCNNILLVTESDSDDVLDDEVLERIAIPKRHGTSLSLAIKTAVSHEENVCDYLKHVNIVCSNSSCMVVFRSFITILAIFMFTIGAIRFHQCPYEEELPLFLVFEGLSIILKSCIYIINVCNKRTKEESNERHCLDTCNDILTLFLVLWTLTGSVWTVGVFVHAESVDSSIPRYCDIFVVLCSLSVIIFIYSCVVIVILLIVALASYFYVKSRSHSNNLPYNVHVDK